MSDLVNPSEEVINSSYAKNFEALYEQALEHPDAFWENVAKELVWYKPWTKVVENKHPYYDWFVGAQCNIISNALDRWQKTEKKDQLALIWEGQDGKVVKYNYGELNEAVSKAGNALKSLGVKKGDRVSIYMPRIPEQIIAMLACAKIGAIHRHINCNS